MGTTFKPANRAPRWAVIAVAIAAAILVPLRLAELFPAPPSLALALLTHLTCAGLGAGVAIVVALVCGYFDEAGA